MPFDPSTLDRLTDREIAELVRHSASVGSRKRNQDYVSLVCSDASPPKPRTKMGAIFPYTETDKTIPLWDHLKAFQAKTGPLACIRPYPSGKTYEAGLTQGNWAKTHFPGVPLFGSCLVVSKGADPARTAACYEGYECVAMDAEPDRKASTTGAYAPRFDPVKWHKAWPMFVANLPRGVRPVVNITGSSFGSRIGTWAPAFDVAPDAILAVDPYLRVQSTGNIQASLAETYEARKWADDHGVDFSFGEWGIDPGTGHLERCKAAGKLIVETRPLHAPYFQADGAWESRLLTAEEFANYRTHVLAPVAAAA